MDLRTDVENGLWRGRRFVDSGKVGWSSDLTFLAPRLSDSSEDDSRTKVVNLINESETML